MTFSIQSTLRHVTGSSASRRLRRRDVVPAIIYGEGKAPQMISLAHNDILLALKKEAFHSSVISLVVDGKPEPVLLRDTQMHAYKPRVLHVDFQRVDATHTIHAKVPLHFINEDVAPGVKLHGGLVSHILSELDISCLPKDLPQYISVDLSSLDVGQSIHVSELQLPSGVKPVVHGHDDQVVVSIVAKRGGGTDDTEANAAPAA